ncbi:MAG: hypothetical protein KFH87_11210 [Bacteroidetes bacterium]|nr:hypothetical protein [Bacteroidota bacterium]
MSPTINALLQKRDAILDQLRSIEHFRRGTVTLHARVCGKPSCRCARDASAKHEQFIWSFSSGGKTTSKHLRPGPEVAKYVEETERYREFKQLVDQLTILNEQLANSKPAAVIDDADTLDALKKKLRRKLLRSSKRNSSVSST